MDRPTIRDGDYGSLVRLVQECLLCEVDGMFGPATEKDVKQFQDNHNLDNDGVVGPATWAKLAEVYDLPPYPPKMLAPLQPNTLREIRDAVAESDVADLLWEGPEPRGQAPLAYIHGMALAYATVVRKFDAGDMVAHEIAKAETGDTEHDALALYHEEFRKLGMLNYQAGRITLRSVFVFLLGLGMQESSGQHCCGRDQSASNVQSETCEAGLFQTSWNYHVCATDAEMLFDEYCCVLERQTRSEPQCQLVAFQKGVKCSAKDWENYGSGKGRQFQELSKICPAFAVESAAVGIRNARKHWGPIGRKEVQIKREAELLFIDIDDILVIGDTAT